MLNSDIFHVPLGKAETATPEQGLGLSYICMLSCCYSLRTVLKMFNGLIQNSSLSRRKEMTQEAVDTPLAVI